MTAVAADEAARPSRALVVWCPDWPVRAWGVEATEPAAVFEASRVTACSAAARHAGVHLGLRRRDAQARCPELLVLERDPLREARTFEALVAAVAHFSPLVEIERPGTCALATRGPSRYFGGDEALAGAILAAVRALEPDARVGVADGAFAATWAARSVTDPASPVLIEPGGSPRFLAALPLTALAEAHDRSAVRRGSPRRATRGAAPAGTTSSAATSSASSASSSSASSTSSPALLVDVLWQLGLRTLGDFAALAETDVLARFGTEAARRHRLAKGVEDRLLDARPPPPDLAAVLEIDPPAERIDQAAFAAKTLADHLHEAMSERGLACTRVIIEAETCHGESMRRLWRHEGALSAAALADRVRWQLEGWLAGSAAALPTGGLSRLALLPDDVVAARGRQLGFWGGETQAAERAARAAARVAGMLGPEAVTVPERRGGRRPDDQFELVPVVATGLVERGPLAATGAPWPGRLPLAPAVVAGAEAAPVEVVDAEGAVVTVNGRGR